MTNEIPLDWNVPEDDEPPPADILDEICEELALEEADSAPGLFSAIPRKGIEPTYGEDMAKIALTTLRKLVYAKNKYLTGFKEAKRRALHRIKADMCLGRISRLNHDLTLTYHTDRNRALGEFQSQLETFSALLLKPEQIKSKQRPLTATKVSNLSNAYETLMFTKKFLPFTPDRNEYLMRVKRSVHGETSVFKVSRADYTEEDRAILAAGLAMINYYSGQKIQMPYTVHLFEGHDAIRVAGLIADYTIKRGVAEYGALESYVRWQWPEAVFGPHHWNLPIQDKHQIGFLLRHILARLIFTDVLEGCLKPVRILDTYQAGLYFQIHPKYLTQKAYKQKRNSS